jgi:hypothetical protein
MLDSIGQSLFFGLMTAHPNTALVLEQVVAVMADIRPDLASAALRRKLKHFVASGCLGDPREWQTGTGRPRAFDREHVYMLAVLLEIEVMRVSVPTLVEIAEWVGVRIAERAAGRPPAEVWAEPGLRLVIALLRGPDGQRHGWAWLGHVDGIIQLPGIASYTVLELPVLFGWLRWP